MVFIPGGMFAMGSERHYPEEAPVHRVTVDSFWIDETPVTNADFRRFVEAAGHVTFAEIAPRRPLHRARAATEGTFKFLPGHIYTARVESVLQARERK